MELEEIRQEIAAIDRDIIRLISERQEYARRIATFKHHEDMPVVDTSQREMVLDRAFDSAVEARVDPARVREIFEILITMNEERQEEFSGSRNLP